MITQELYTGLKERQLTDFTFNHFLLFMICVTYNACGQVTRCDTVVKS